MTQLELEQKVRRLEAIIDSFNLSDRFAFQKNIQMRDGLKIQVGNTNGLMIGASDTQKLGFWGTTPKARVGLSASPSVEDISALLTGIGLASPE